MSLIISTFFSLQVYHRLSETVRLTIKLYTHWRFSVYMATMVAYRRYFYSNWLHSEVENWGKWSMLWCSNGFDDFDVKAVCCVKVFAQWRDIKGAQSLEEHFTAPPRSGHCEWNISSIFHDRLNLTNVAEPFFVIDSLDSYMSYDTFGDDSLKAVVFAVNQKGRSQGALVKEFVIDGATENRAGNYFESFLLSKDPTRLWVLLLTIELSCNKRWNGYVACLAWSAVYTCTVVLCNFRKGLLLSLDNSLKRFKKRREEQESQ